MVKKLGRGGNADAYCSCSLSEKLLGYMLRAPVSLKRLQYGPDGMVTYRGKYNPALGRDYQHVSGLEFLAMCVPHILWSDLHQVEGKVRLGPF